MITEFLTKAKAGKPVYISTVYEAFQQLSPKDSQTLHCVLTLLEQQEQRYFPLCIPKFSGIEQEDTFVKEYVQAELYNILSSLGGIRMDIYVNTLQTDLLIYANELHTIFGVDKSRKERKGYGRAINVIDRMLFTLAPNERGFKINVYPVEDLPVFTSEKRVLKQDLGIYSQVTQGLEGKILCGIDVGGTDIKSVLVEGGKIQAYKEYDWFPAKFTTSKELVEPICLIVRLFRAKASLEAAVTMQQRSELLEKMDRALHISASEELMEQVCSEIEGILAGKMVEIDGVGMCFPDVVVRNKIVGGEVYKTRGIRNNPLNDYEEDFTRLTNLNDRIQELIKPTGVVAIINDGAMAAFTAAVEIAASPSPKLIEAGVFAHTLGTELGTGWVTEKGKIHDLPLEVYNFIIDLGSYGERKFEPDDLRSINNFNTLLPGTLQKYASQSGIFRLALKYFPVECPELFQELLDKGFVTVKEESGMLGYYVPTEPKDMRKPFLEHLMSLPEREGDEVNARIWRELGEFLAVTWFETKKILNPVADSRVLFGRLVKRKRCYDLICEGARAIKPDLDFEVADSTLAYTPLMRQLDADPHFTVAQFAQAVGATYFANK